MENQTKKPDCDHIGFHLPVTQTVLIIKDEIWIVTSHNCSNCGRVFDLIDKVSMNDQFPKQDKLVTPNEVPGLLLDHQSGQKN